MACGANSFPTFRYNLSVPSSRFKKSSSLRVKESKKISWPLKTVQIGCTETSVRNYHHTLRDISDDSRSDLLRGGAWNHANYVRFRRPRQPIRARLHTRRQAATSNQNKQRLYVISFYDAKPRNWEGHILRHAVTMPCNFHKSLQTLKRKLLLLYLHWRKTKLSPKLSLLPWI